MAFKIPESEVASLVSPVTARLVVVTLVAVALVTVSACMVEDAPRMMRPRVEVVGASAPPATILNASPNALYPAGA